MRFALSVTAAVILMAACKSKDKHQDTAKPAAPPAAATATKDAAKAVKDTAKKAATAATEAVSGSKVECKNGGDTRTLEVRGKDKGCETAYTKGGQENVVGSSQNGTSHCEGIMTRIKEKLAAAGFTCN